jgi:hypothetical protein
MPFLVPVQCSQQFRETGRIRFTPQQALRDQQYCLPQHIRERTEWGCPATSQASSQGTRRKAKAHHLTAYLYRNRAIPEGVHEGEVGNALLRLQAAAAQK